MKTIWDIGIGECAVVMRLHGESARKRRAMDMGLTPGARVCVQRIAPLGDPMAISVRGYELSLRKADARAIEVERL